MASDRLLRPPSISDQFSDDGDELNIPESIYAQLQYLEVTYGRFAGDEEDSYDELSEEEGALDLSAPPPES